MTTNSIPGIGLIFAAVVFVGCASRGVDPETPKEPRVCVKISQINSYSALDDQHVYVNVTGKDNYLMTVEGVCSGLTFARGIAVAEMSSRVCGDGAGMIIFNHPGVGSKRCRIVKIEVVADKDAALALIESDSGD